MRGDREEESGERERRLRVCRVEWGEGIGEREEV